MFWWGMLAGIWFNALLMIGWNIYHDYKNIKYAEKERERHEKIRKLYEVTTEWDESNAEEFDKIRKSL